MSFPQVSYRALRVWQRNRDVFLQLWKSELAPYFVEPVLILLVMGLGLGAYIGLIGEQSYLDFIAPGIIGSYAMFSATFECTYGSYIRMEHQRTYDAIIATPVSIGDIIAGEILWAATRSMMTACAIIVIALALGLIHSPLAILVVLLAAIEGLMFGSLAMSFTAISPSITFFNYFFTLLVTPMFFFSGVFFPLSGLPEVVQRLAWLLPLTPVVSITRALISGELSLGLVPKLAYILVVTALFFTISLLAMRRRLVK